MVRVDEIMSSPVVTVGVDDPLKDVAMLLVERGFGAAPVRDGEGRLVGILTEADLIRLELNPDPRRHAIPVPERPSAPPATAGEAMSAPVYAVPPETDVAEVARLMLERHVTRVPVVVGERLVGIVSRRDLLRVLARPDEVIGVDLRRCLAQAAADARWQVRVTAGTAILRGGPDAESHLVTTVARTIPGVVDVRIESG
jgi:CBS domain-containing protein